MPINLPITLVCVDTHTYGNAVESINKTLDQITPQKTVFFTDINIEVGIEIHSTKHFYSKRDYSNYLIKELGKYPFETSHILVIQHDGYVLDANCWEDEFLQYDYIGAPWLYSDEKNVGNGGFSLRSTRLHKILAEDDFILPEWDLEDDAICRTYRNYLEQKYDIKFAPEAIAHRFSYELHEPKQPTFGFHGNFHKPYVEPIVIKRTAALGDVIQVEPILEYFHKKGHPVYLDTLPEFYLLFARHHFPVGDYSKFDKEVIKHRVIDLDLAYEVQPRQLHLLSYFQMCGISDYALRNPKLNYYSTHENKLFKKYVVIHIDERDTEERNIVGVDWLKIRLTLEAKGYTVIQIGRGKSPEAGLFFNTVNLPMCMWLISGCKFFIGIDSGPSHIAVALQKKCFLFFGSVNPHFIHHDLSNIIPFQSPCPVFKTHCWHSQNSTTGVECEVSPSEPPCTIHKTENIIDRILARV